MQISLKILWAASLVYTWSRAVWSDFFSEDFEDVGLFQLPWPVILNEQVPEYQ